VKKLTLLLLIVLSVLSCSKDDVLRFEVYSGELPYFDCPVSIDISSMDFVLAQDPNVDLNKKVILKELSNGRIKEVPVQITSGEKTLLWLVMEGITYAGESRSYRLFLNEHKSDKPVIEYSINSDEVRFFKDDHDIFRYRRSEILPPEGVDPIYKRSAYIHPLVTPGGEVLTRIQPPDHYHHYGIWNPWTKTHIKGREIDYWNLSKGQGTVRHTGINSIIGGSVFGQLIASQECIDFGSIEAERKTMDEEWNCKVWSTFFKEKRYALDLQTTLVNVLDDTILFDTYRYGGGIGFRATEKWNAENCTVLTSEGLDRKAADGSKAKWCLIEGASDADEGRSGILFLSHSDNREHPEPMRVWPESVLNGELFFEFCPIRHNDWFIEPGKEYVLKYRMIVFDGKVSPDEADMYWNGFVHMPNVVIR
jgi:hypothetical protein